MIQIHFNEVAVQVADGQAPDGQPIKLLLVTDQLSGIQAVIPFHPQAAGQIASALMGIEIARPNGAPLPADFERRVRKLGG